MRPPTSWTDLAGLRVGVWGLGVEGRATVGVLERRSVTPLLVDRQVAEVAGLPVVPEGPEALAGLLACDVVIKSPGISPNEPSYGALERAGVPIVSALGLWLGSVDRDRVLLVTGTKGKSTTSSVAGHMATQLGRQVFVGGNIGRPPYDVDAPVDVDLWIIEVSSFQAAGLHLSTPVVAVTALGEDHLDWHGSWEQYVEHKLSLCTKPGSRVTVAADVEHLRARAGLLGQHVRWVDRTTWDERWSQPLGLVGPHNATNAAVARAALIEVGLAELRDDETASSATQGFRPLKGRYELVGDVGGVRFIDDGLSTNALPTVAALASTDDERVALLVGGHDRGISYEPLLEALRGRDRPTLVICLSDAGRRILDAIEQEPIPAVVAHMAPSLHEAVREAWGWAAPSGTVLLSPAAPSFGMFANHEERSAAFRRCVAEIAASHA